MMEYVKRRTFPKKERDFLLSFMAEVKKRRPNMWSFKVHGEPMQVRGVPDILMCYEGLFLGLEFKIIRGGSLRVSPLQTYTIDLIRGAGGFATIVAWNEATGAISIGAKTFETMKQAVDHFVEILDVIINIPAKDLRKALG
jgi:hypothetical protein